jgi:hypothetical protein
MPNNLIRVKDTRYANACDRCGKPIPAHSQSLWDKQNNKNYHPSCEPHANPIGSSKNAQGDGSQPNDPKTISEKVEARLRKAKGIVDKVFPEASGYSDYLNLVNESFRQLQSERWLELEKAKSRLNQR